MIYVIIAILVFIGDIISKYIAEQHLIHVRTIPLIENVFHLTYVENRGMAFGMFSGQRWFILLLTGIIAVGLIWFYVMMPKKKEYFPLRVSLVLVLSGAIGNIIDRLFRGYVVDFFEFTFFEWPVFNVADIYVVVGVILLALMLIFVVKEEDLDFKKKKDE